MLSDAPLFRVERFGWLWLLLLALVVLASGLGLRDPWPADEPRFALVAKEMVESGQWFFPMRGGEIYPDKPPMFMWLIGLGFLITGSLKIAFLLPSLLAGLGALGLTWDLSRRLWGERTAFIAGLVLLLTVQFTLQAKTAQIDALVTFFITLGFYGFMRFLLLGGGWRWFYLGFFAAGIGVITKGVGIVAALVLIPAIYTHFNEIRAAKREQWIAGFKGAGWLLGAIALWVVPMVLLVAFSDDSTFTAYRDNILFRQTVTRYANAWHHVKPFWFYVVEVIPTFWLPFSLLLPWLVVDWARAIKGGDKRITLLLGYLLLIVLFFSLSSGKRGVYITPATPAFALLVAPWLEARLSQRWPKRLLHGLGWLLAVVAAAGGIAIMVSDKLAAKVAEVEGTPWLILLGLGALFALINWALRRAPLSAVLVTLMAGWLAYSLVIMPRLNNMRTPESIMTAVAQELKGDEALLIAGFKEQHLLFSRTPLWHYSYKMGNEEQSSEVAAWISAEPKRRVLGTQSILKVCFDLSAAKNMGNRHRTDWYLVDAEQLKPECRDKRVSVQPFFYQPKIIYSSN